MAAVEVALLAVVRVAQPRASRNKASHRSKASRRSKASPEVAQPYHLRRLVVEVVQPSRLHRYHRLAVDQELDSPKSGSGMNQSCQESVSRIRRT